MIQKANASLTPQAFAQMSEGLSQDYADMLGDLHRVCASIQSKLDALPARLQPLLRDGSLNARQESDAHAHAHLVSKEDSKEDSNTNTLSPPEFDSRHASEGVGLAMLGDHVPAQAPLLGQEVKMMKMMLPAQETACSAASQILEHVGIARLVLESGACARSGPTFVAVLFACKRVVDGVW